MPDLRIYCPRCLDQCCCCFESLQQPSGHFDAFSKKHAIAKKAAEFLTNGDSVFINFSETWIRNKTADTMAYQ